MIPLCSSIQPLRYFIFISEPWETFMSHYTELHPGLVNREATQSSLQATPSSLQATPSSLQATTSSSHKRGRGQGTGGNDGDMKKLKLSSDRPCCDENQSEQVPVPPVVLFTGISQPVVKKLKSVSALVWLATCRYSSYERSAT